MGKACQPLSFYVTSHWGSGKHSNRQSLEFIGVRGKMWIFKRVTQKLDDSILLALFSPSNASFAVSFWTWIFCLLFPTFFFQSLSFLTSPISGFSAHCLECGCHQTQGPCFHPYLSLSDLVTCGPLADSCSCIAFQTSLVQAPPGPHPIFFLSALLFWNPSSFLSEGRFLGRSPVVPLSVCLFLYLWTHGSTPVVPLSAACAWLSLSSPSQPFKSPPNPTDHFCCQAY